MNVASLKLCKELYEVSGWKTETMSMGLHQNAPAYDLGYLIRKLQPENVSVHPMGDGKRWYADNMGGGGQNYQSRTADTPEDALCALAIELFKQGVLK